MDCRDEKLETYIANMKGDVMSERLLAYKKATRRLDSLQNEYDECVELMKPSKKKKKSDRDLDSILDELTTIESSFDDGSLDMKDMITNFMRCKMLLSNLELETSNIKNKIMKVGMHNGEIVIEKLKLEELL